jgi:hypothetical protein
MDQGVLSFESWMEHVDTAVQALAYVSVHDLEDQPFRDWWRSGWTPQEAALEALEYAGYPVELFDDE